MASITIISPIPEIFTAAEQVVRISLSMNGISGYTAMIRTSWIEMISITPTELTIKITANVTQEQRSGQIAIYGSTSSGENIIKTFTISQDTYYCYPVWKDIFIDTTTIEDYLDYELRIGNETIYSGRAHKLPDETKISFNINRIVADYLSNSLNLSNYKEIDFVSFEKNNDAWKQIDVVVNGEIINSFDYYNNWSYDDSVAETIPNNGVFTLSRPIRKVLDRRQLFVATVLNAYNWEPVTQSYTCNFIDNGGTTEEQLNYPTKGVYTAINGQLDNYDKITFYDDEYVVKETCNKYCLYYSNAYGGWDSFLINGNDVKQDKITSSSFVKGANSSNTLDFQKKKYLNSMTTQYTLYTDYLTDDEASKMYNLLESVNVYLHDLETNKIIAVNITNSTCDYKTFTNNGKKKFYYTINVEESQTKMRK